MNTTDIITLDNIKEDQLLTAIDNEHGKPDNGQPDHIRLLALTALGHAVENVLNYEPDEYDALNMFQTIHGIQTMRMNYPDAGKAAHAFVVAALGWYAAANWGNLAHMTVDQTAIDKAYDDWAGVTLETR
ncbi:hypothetical protein [Bifidobacterium callitrichidarum]|uniref:Uncharacterized protein n=1 Tax=Bifidobacterium callitrichidarum TaxID=2052941 RepID=A0A2U2NCB5_9BIFI|nr:hypothetical protein [Bifidobacterium callitrichidarum]PWG66762.1 hypothetical protein DF196_02345 [Bifidobacterium callitrichidarum]